jgi:hypothetical protein
MTAAKQPGKKGQFWKSGHRTCHEGWKNGRLKRVGVNAEMPFAERRFSQMWLALRRSIPGLSSESLNELKHWQVFWLALFFGAFPGWSVYDC